MAEVSIPVDLFNPGQVFACLGFVEVAEVLLGHAAGGFDWSAPGAARFWLRADGSRSPVEHVLEFLAQAEVFGEVPARSPHAAVWKGAWGPVRTRSREDGYPYPEPDSPATVVCVLSREGVRVVIDHWGDELRDNVKFWAGAGGYPGAALARDALDLVRERLILGAADPFAIAAPQSSSFRLDWRRDYIPIDAGFSLNEHDHIKAVGYPIVEVLAAIGLSHARPRRPGRSKLEYLYGVVGVVERGGLRWHPPSILRAALGAASLPLPSRWFRMQLGWPGKEGQARAITTVTEEKTG